ncbi:MAG: type IV pilus twitching motility protein PilT [Candidatus Peregrinibacteria bacterium]|nr:type IV pilus twitching motility protein PilT [Candidatus Peregrinibacteria bacterium]MDZ4244537.1 type IV pilus twitching motility protein PilT [Candidatus Gracilibacteria bacterium]
MSDQVNKILKTAVEYGASDVFISCGSKPSLRINGDLVIIDQHDEVDEMIFEEYLNFLATDSQKNKFAETRDLDFSIHIENLGRFRVNMFVQRKGPSAVLRPIPHNIKSIDELNLPEQLKDITKLESGLILLTGPTGSGKSTTLAAMINEINTANAKHIITIEDPIEFVHDNKMSIIEQREVGTHTDSFGTALRAALREDPDVILVGEMRDLETIAMAVTAAETGHLVFGTLHTAGAPNTIDRIIDVFPPNQQSQIKTQLAMSLKAVIWQKLIPTINGKTRIPAIEIMMNTNAIANLIRKGSTHQIYSSMETGMREGMQTMSTALRTLVQQGHITENQMMYHLGEIMEDEPNNQQQQ